jgi:hypothetical protein
VLLISSGSLCGCLLQRLTGRQQWTASTANTGNHGHISVSRYYIVNDIMHGLRGSTLQHSNRGCFRNSSYGGRLFVHPPTELGPILVFFHRSNSLTSFIPAYEAESAGVSSVGTGIQRHLHYPVCLFLHQLLLGISQGSAKTVGDHRRRLCSPLMFAHHT